MESNLCLVALIFIFNNMAVFGAFSPVLLTHSGWCVGPLTPSAVQGHLGSLNSVEEGNSGSADCQSSGAGGRGGTFLVPIFPCFKTVTTGV